MISQEIVAMIICVYYIHYSIFVLQNRENAGYEYDILIAMQNGIFDTNKPAMKKLVLSTCFF
jgi:hypothetical protein